jgi:hypothetical protein
MNWSPVAQMTAAALAVWLGLLVALGRNAHPEAFVGMVGPLAAANISWLVMVRARLAGPDRLMAVMIMAAAAKMVFFGAYVALAFGGMALRPVPFIVSFTVCFIGLYGMEAYFLKRYLVDPSVDPTRGVS